MKFSMNGFRRQLHTDLDDLKQILERVMLGKHFDTDELAESFNIIVQHSNLLNCVYSDKEDEFSDLSNLHLEGIESHVYD